MNDRKATHIASLLRKRQVSSLTEAEENELRDWLAEDPSHAELFQRLSEPAFLQAETRRFMSYVAGDAWDHPELGRALRQDRKPRRVKRWIPYAAAVAALLAVGWLLLVVSQKPSVDSLAATEILPGGNRATLTLADGRVINLDEAQTGIVIGDEDITYVDGTSLALSPAGEPVPTGREGRDGQGDGRGRPDEIQMLALTTPKGGTYQVTLPDGSKVWLNSASTLKYPSRFSGDSREVFLEGEAFFDIRKQAIGATAQGPVEAHDYAPFSVLTAGQVVEVLGTQFNISAYADDEETKTTLVEGKVKVTPGTIADEAKRSPEHREGLTTHDSRLTTKILQPGDQSIVRARLPGQGASIETHRIEVDQYTAWRDGYFNFDDAPLEAIMRQIARWYDVSVEYGAGVDRQAQYWGGVSRYEDINTVLQRLEAAGGIRFQVKERRVIVTR